ncbi:MAG: hypothetical protein K6G27_14405, partial [Lachnospiraceae bacterium]|nr:hypothetical protein [Lachnospiraceae bacterium]
NNVDDMIINLKEYIDNEKDEILGKLYKYIACSELLEMNDNDLRKIKSLRDSITDISNEYDSIDEYVINACTLTMINDKLISNFTL